MTLTLPASPKPDSKPQLKAEAKIIRVDFDGYSQRIGQGLNNIKQSMTLTWTNILQTESDNLVNFFKQHAGGQAFFWTPPDGVQRKWSINQGRWTQTIQGAGFADVTVDIVQEFDP